MGYSRNTKKEIKDEVLQAVDRLFQLIKEAEAENALETVKVTEVKEQASKNEKSDKNSDSKQLVKKLEEHAILIKENTQKMDELKATMDKKSYASVAAAPAGNKPPTRAALHSVVISANITDTSEEVLSRIRKAINAKEGGTTIERIRKAKDGKVIVGCKTEQERDIVRERLKKQDKELKVENIKNKDPLVCLYGVLQSNKDEDILKAIHKQNQHILAGLDEQTIKLEIAYRRPARNPHTSHIVMRVSPKIWERLTVAGSIHIDLQRVRVADQSPLVQCSLCLGYGHGKRFCTDTIKKCSHCGGNHMRSTCADWLEGVDPSCCNCKHAKLPKSNHNAFSNECPIRQKWDEIARSTIAYS